MRLLGFDPSRVTLLTQGFRLAGQLYWPPALAEIVKVYNFRNVPEHVARGGPQKITLELGVFDGAAIESVDIFNDGIIVTSRSNTSVMDGFIENLTSLMSENWGMDFIKSKSVNRMYQSALVFETDKDILGPLEGYQKVGEAVRAKLQATVGLDASYDPFGFSLSPDQTKFNGLKPGMFKIERRIIAEYEFNQYFSFAPLRTDDHLKILADLEKSL